MTHPERIEGKEFVLRFFTVDDNVEYSAAGNDEAVAWNLPDKIHPMPLTEQRASAMINMILMTSRDPTKKVVYAVEVDGVIVGIASLFVDEDDSTSAEVGYWYAKHCWGRGLATKVGRLITDYGFKQMGLGRIWGGVYEWNAASMRVLTKLGFTDIGPSEKSVLVNGEMHCPHIFEKFRP